MFQSYRGQYIKPQNYNSRKHTMKRMRYQDVNNFFEVRFMRKFFELW